MTLARFYVLAGAASIIAIAIALFVGPWPLSPANVLRALFGEESPAGVVIREVRLPRAIAAFLAGAALAASGATLQGLLRNPLADPGVLGVSSAAALGAVIAIYFNLAGAATAGASIAAIGGALLAALLLHALGAGRLSATRLILVGVGLSSLIGAAIALVMNLAPNPFVLSDLVNWLFGSVANRSFADLGVAAPFMAAGLALALLSARGLSALTLGEEAAIAVGADLRATRFLAIGGAALMTGAAVAIAGAVGFVGIIAPHLARPFVGHDPGRAILPSALIGGALLCLADVAVRLAPFDQELKLGVAAALFGAPAFIAIAAATQKIAR
jgi:iron complex transport system permease protein